mmetsp:Transcript_25324/g.54014  ORF Transcript_25324/g.54014 Transcript_25324/m.54014 type:complete len:282 (-) Transcript_25324:3086-3931(-)
MHRGHSVLDHRERDGETAYRQDNLAQREHTRCRVYQGPIAKAGVVPAPRFRAMPGRRIDGRETHLAAATRRNRPVPELRRLRTGELHPDSRRHDLLVDASRRHQPTEQRGKETAVAQVFFRPGGSYRRIRRRSIHPGFQEKPFSKAHVHGQPKRRERIGRRIAGDSQQKRLFGRYRLDLQIQLGRTVFHFQSRGPLPAPMQPAGAALPHQQIGRMGGLSVHRGRKRRSLYFQLDALHEIPEFRFRRAGLRDRSVVDGSRVRAAMATGTLPGRQRGVHQERG